ncbi:MAG: PAS domain S-box protein [Ghiorsea sp.]
MSEVALQTQLDAANETIAALSKRLQHVESGSKHTPFQQQLNAYQDRIEKEASRLRDMQEWSQLLVENSMEAIVGMDPEGNITRWNHRAEVLFGWKEAEAVGQPFSLVVSADGIHVLSDGLQTQGLQVGMCESKLGDEAEILAIHKDGNTLPVGCVVLLLNQKGVSSFVVFLRDIRDRKQAEALLIERKDKLERLVEERTEEVRKSEERFAFAMQGANDGLWDWDLLTDNVYFSPRWKSMLGYQPHELGSRLDDWSSRVHPDEIGAVMEKVEAYLTGKTSFYEAEMRIRHKSGVWVNVLSRGFKVLAEDGLKPIRLVGTHLDITERKKEEQERSQLAAIIEATSDFVGVADTQGKVIYVNSGGKTMVGLADSVDVVGMQLTDFHSKEETNRFIHEILPKAAEGSNVRVLSSFQHQDGHDIPASVVVTANRSSRGKLTGYAIVARDISHEQSLQRQMEHVDRLESLGVLAGGIAHDFNNILASILGNTGLAKRSLSVESPVYELLNKVEKSSGKAAGLCHQMLAYSGKGKFVIQQANLSHVITEMMSLLEVSISKDVRMELFLEDNLPAIDGDITQIQQVIMNLVINASESMEAGEKCLTIETGVASFGVEDKTIVSLPSDMKNHQQYVYLKVKDMGCGMSEEIRRKVFDPFFTTKFTGRGLGMSAVVGIVSGHEGVIKLETKEHVGTTFTIGFPIIEPDNFVAEAVVNTDRAVSEGLMGTMLVIDDEEDIRELTQVLLEDLGCDVLLAANGLEGVTLFKEHVQDIKGVVLDMTMPGMNGKECFEALQKINPEVKVILISGYAEEEVMKGFENGGVAGFIKKPFMVDEFEKQAVRLFK